MSEKPCSHKLLKKQMSGMQVWYVCSPDQWISVDSRVKPKDDQVVILYLPDWDKPERNPMPLGHYISSLDEWRPVGSMGWSKSVTHWRPMPTPPSAESCGQKFKAQEWDGRIKVLSSTEQSTK